MNDQKKTSGSLSPLFPREELPPRTHEHRSELDRLLYAGVPFPQLEEWIEALTVSEEAKAGLWLLAWADQERSTRRRIAEEALAAVER